MLTRDERIFRRYNPGWRRVLSVFLTAICLPFLTGTDRLLADQVNASVAAQTEARYSHQRLRETAPQVLHGSIAPRLRAAAVAAKDAEKAAAESRRAELKRLSSELARVRLAVLDNIQEADQAAAAAKPTEAVTRVKAANAQVLQTVSRLQASCDTLLSSSTARHAAAITEILRLTEPSSSDVTLPCTRTAGDTDAVPGNKGASLPSNPLLRGVSGVSPDGQSMAGGFASGSEKTLPGTQSESPNDPAAAGADSAKRVGAGTAPAGGAGAEPLMSEVPSSTLLDLSRIPAARAPILLASAADTLAPLFAGGAPGVTGLPVSGDRAVAAPQTSASAAVTTLATDLKTPVKIFEHFRNGFVYEPYFGAVKGAERTLAEKAGNDVDIASAMISVMRAAGIPCRYVYGTIRLTTAQAACWLGVDAALVPQLLANAGIPYRVDGVAGSGDVLVDHVWVKAYIDYLPYRGATDVPTAGASESGHFWVDIDPAFKQHVFSVRRNVEADLNLNSSVFLGNVRVQTQRSALNAPGMANNSGTACDDYVSALPQGFIANEVIGAANRLVELMNTQQLTLDTVFRERVIADESYGILPCTDLYKIEARGASWSQFPDQLTAKVSVSMTGADGQQRLSYNAPVAALLDHSLTLNWAPASPEEAAVLQQWLATHPVLPATDPNYKAEMPCILSLTGTLSLDGTSVATTNAAVTLGARQSLNWQFEPAGAALDSVNTRTVTALDSLNAGTPTAFVFAAGRTTDDQVVAARLALAGPTPALPALLRAVGLTYFYQADRFGLITAGVLNQYACRVPSLIRVSHGLDVTEFAGQPYTAAARSLELSVVRDGFMVAPIAQPAAGELPSAAAASAFTAVNAMVSSALGCNSLSQCSGQRADSTASLLQTASAASGVLTLTPPLDAAGKPTGAPYALSVFDGLDLAAGFPPLAKNRILDLLNLGCSVTFSKDAVQDVCPLQAVDPLTGDTGLFLLDANHDRGLVAGATVDMQNAYHVSALLGVTQPTVPAAVAAAATDWLNALSDATISTGISYVPTLAHIKNFFTAGAQDSGKLSTTALGTTAAAIALMGRIVEISGRPGIINLAADQQFVSPNGDGLLDTLHVTGQATRAGSWTVSFTSAGAVPQTRTFTSAGGSASVINVTWDGRDEIGNPFPQGRATWTATVSLPAGQSGDPVSVTREVTVDTVAPAAVLNVTKQSRSGREVYTFTGTANDANFDFWSLELVSDSSGQSIGFPGAGTAQDPKPATGTTAVQNGNFGVLDSAQIPNGNWHAVLTVLDRAGNGEVATATTHLTISNPVPDTTAPAISVSSPALDPDNGVLSSTIPVTVVASDDAAIASVQVLIDGDSRHVTFPDDAFDTLPTAVLLLDGSFNCADLADGVHTLQVKVTDVSGNAAETEVWEFLSSQVAPDNTGPELTLTVPDSGSAPLTGAFDISAAAVDNVAVKTIAIYLDGAVKGEVTDPAAPANLVVHLNAAQLADGPHTIVAVAADPTGNTTRSNPVPITTSRFLPDTQAPSLTMTMPDPAVTLTGSIPVTVTASDNIGVKTIEILLDGAVHAAAPLNPSPAVLAATIDATAIPEGQHTVQARAADAAGNLSSTQAVTITTSHATADTSAPVVNLDFAPGSGTLTGTVPAHATAVDNVGVTRLEILLDGGIVAAADNPAAPATLDFTVNAAQLTAGSHALAARAYDAAGNSKTTPAVTFTSNPTAPDTLAPQVSLGAPSTAEKISSAFAVSAAAADNVGVTSLQILLDGAVVATGTNGDLLSYEVNPAAISDGTHTLQARAKDAANNEGATALVTFLSAADVTPPQLSMGWPQPAANQPLTGTFKVTAAASDPGGVAKIEILLDSAVAAAVTNPQPANLGKSFDCATLVDGTHTIGARAVDGSGNVATLDPVTITTSRTAPDTTPPALTFYFPAVQNPLSGTVTARAVASDNTSVAEIRILVDGTAVATAATPVPAELAYALDTTPFAKNSQHTISAAAKDPAGNETVLPVITFTVDNDLPDTQRPEFTATFGSYLTIDSRASDNLYTVADPVAGTVQVQVNATDNKGLKASRLYLDGTLLRLVNGAAAASLSYALDTAVLSDGQHLLRFEVEDTATPTANVNGAKQILFATRSDVMNPTATITVSATDLTKPVRGDIQVRVSATDNKGISRILLSLDGAAIASAVSPVPAELTYTLRAAVLPDGAHTLTARAVDTSGNAGDAAPVSFTSANPISNFKVTPRLLRPGMATGTTITVSATLKTAAAWTLTFTGPTAITSVTGTTAAVSKTLDGALLADGDYSVTLTVAGLDDKPEIPFTVDLITGPPVAKLTIPGRSDTPFADGSAPAVRITEGLAALTGTADDPDSSDPVKWKLALYDIEGGLVKDLTPDPRTVGWHVGRVPAGSALTTADFTMVENGVYELALTVMGDTDVASDSVSIILDSQLKVGQFSFSQQDLVIPVSGMPISVIRTYNSLNSKAGEFGYGWTYAISDIKFETDDRYGTAYDADGTAFQRRIGGGRNVTVTLPDGRRTTFQYSLKWGPGQYNYSASWKAPPGVNATLVPTCSNKLLTLPAMPGMEALPPYWEAGGPTTTMDAFEFPGYTLTMQDGSQYLLTRPVTGEYFEYDEATGADSYVKTYGTATLTRITQRSGDRIEFRGDRTGIDSYNSAGEKTRSVVFHRDGQKRIVAIHDPAGLDDLGNPAGPAAVTYEYDANGNLVKVNKLKDSTDPDNAVYETIEYLYAEDNKPLHYITSIKDARGLAPMRTLYDDDGRITGTVDANGKTITLTHNLADRSETIYDRAGNPTVHYYDAKGNVTATVDAQGNTTSRTYDALGNEVTVTDPLGNVTTSTYDAQSNRTSVTDPLGNTTRYTYDSYGNQLTVTDPLGNVTRNEYDAKGNLVATVNALGQRTESVYDGSGNLTATKDVLGNVTATFGYDRNGNMTSTTDANGVTRSFSYDRSGNQTGTSFTWTNPANANDHRNVITQTIYNAAGQVVSSVDPEGKTTATEYNAIGKPWKTTDKFGQVTTTLYDARGNVVATQYPDGTGSVTVYDDNGRGYLSLDRFDISAATTGGSPGKVLLIPSDITANGSLSIYDTVGRVVRSERRNGITVHLANDAQGQPSTTVTGNGTFVSASGSSYDAAGRVTESTSSSGAVTRYEYDAAGRQTAVLSRELVPNGQGGSTEVWHRSEYSYDAGGRQTVVTDALGRQTRFEYDTLGRRAKTIFADGTFTTTDYNVLGQRVAETDQAGVTRNFEYDTQGRLVGVLLPAVPDPDNGNAMTRPHYVYGYNVYGQLETITDAKGRITRFSYDQLGRQLTRTLPMGQQESQQYDEFGRLAKKFDFKGQAVGFEYDQIFGRLTAKKLYEAGSTTASATIGFTYDNMGRQASVADGNGTTYYFYDADGRVVEVRNPAPQGSIFYAYNELGQKTRTSTANSDVRYSYDELGRLQTVEAWKQNGVALNPAQVTTYSYTEIGSRAAQVLPNGIVTTYDYDSLNRLTNLTHAKSSGQVLASYDYTLAATGRRTGVVERMRQAVTNTLAQTTISYTYDQLNRLTHESSVSDLAEATFATSYSYDLVGNRKVKDTTRNSDGNVERIEYMYNENDQLLIEHSSLEANGNTSYTYDTNGSQVTKDSPTKHESATYEYNVENRMIRADIARVEKDVQGVSRNMVIRSDFKYDQSGIRTSAACQYWVNGAATPQDRSRTFLVDHQNHTGYAQVLEEFASGQSTPVTSYVIGDDVLGQCTGGVASWLLYDGHGSTRALTGRDAQQHQPTITARYTFDAYGMMLGGDPTLSTPADTDMLYSGEQFDPALQQQYLRARYYDQASGRFSVQDDYPGMKMEPLRYHKYAYCNQNPVSAIDPSGRFTLVELGVVCFMLGILITSAILNMQAAKDRAVDRITEAHGAEWIAVIKKDAPSFYADDFQRFVEDASKDPKLGQYTLEWEQYQQQSERMRVYVLGRNYSLVRNYDALQVLNAATQLAPMIAGLPMMVSVEGRSALVYLPSKQHGVDAHWATIQSEVKEAVRQGSTKVYVHQSVKEGTQGRVPSLLKPDVLGTREIAGTDELDEAWRFVSETRSPSQNMAEIRAKIERLKQLLGPDGVYRANDLTPP